MFVWLFCGSESQANTLVWSKLETMKGQIIHKGEDGKGGLK